MRFLKKNLIVFLFFNILICSYFTSYSQLKPAELKANWIYIIGENVTFPNQDSIDTINVAVYGKNSEVFFALKKLSQKKLMQNKTVKAVNVSRISQLTGYNIVYVDQSKNDFIESIYNKIHRTQTLLITYQIKNQKFFMINLLLKGVKEQFQIQSSNLYDEKIVANDKLISLGGTKVDLQGLFEKKVRQLEQKEIELTNKEKLLQKKEDKLQSLQEKIDLQKKENEKQEKLIKEQKQQLEQEKQNATKLLEQVAVQEQVLKNNKFILNNLNKEIAAKQNLIKKQNDSLSDKKAEIQKKQDELKEQQKRIDKQKKVLSTQDVQIETQQNIITFIIIVGALLLLLSIIIWKSYRQNKKKNNQLRKQNAKIENQKQKLTNQAIQLEEFNKELTKLSLVASKTDNSVIIMDKKSNFEWVNSGFTRIYGYTLQLLRNEKGKSLIEISEDEKERKEKIKLLDKCISTKKTVIYQNQNITRNDEKIWVQTSLTPVLNENDEVIQLIAIESNITKLKKQEVEITQKNEELQMQKAELQSQKEMLEEVNNQIKDSINYALTIQKAMLPPLNKINQSFANFIIYLPRDIVSGDFYWYANPSENIFFFAAVDCTGHGVPGAFMSLISSRMLDEIVNVQHICQPKTILKILNKMIVHSLNQETTNNRDGMDLALVKINNNNNNILFAGAKRPLIYYKHNDKKIYQIKGNRRSIGGMQSMLTKFKYTDQKLKLEKNDIIYLSTDGMIDQNNNKRKRYGTPRFIESLDKANNLPFKNQKIKIIEDFNNFKKDEKQRDDITVWAIKI